MDVLYRRFAVVAGLIITMGVLTSYLIQETRTSSLEIIQQPRQIQNRASAAECKPDTYCSLSPVFASEKTVLAG